MTFIHHHRPEVPSTNQWAMDWLKDELPSRPVLFTADHQSAGKGQRERLWHSERGQDVAMSLVLPARTHWTPASLNKRVALSVRSTLLKMLPQGQSDRAVLVKWPNDILVWHGAGHFKVAGILLENVWRGSTWSHAIVGVGLNVRSRRLTQSYRAISLSEAWQAELAPNDLAKQLAMNLVSDLNQSFDGLSEAYGKALFARGECRPYLVNRERVQGTLLSVDDQGRGHFNWEVTQDAAPNPSNRLASSDVTWCWPRQDA